MEDCRLQEETDQLGLRKRVQVGSFLSNIRQVLVIFNQIRGWHTSSELLPCQLTPAAVS